nr:mycofactocin system GMC family oxidoreductase MftG [Gordonia humi]
MIVGAGSAGCVLAERLSRDPARQVLLVERGPADVSSAPLDRLPIDSPARAVSVPEGGGRPVVRGRGLGGSSAINGGYFLRGHRADYVSWPWPEAEIADAFRVATGLMRATPFADAELGDVARAFETWHAGATNTAAWPTEGVNRVWSNRVDGARWTSAHVLAAAGPRPGLTVRPDVEAVALTTRETTVTGVRTADDEVIVAREVIVCAGTLGTAILLSPLTGPLPVHEHAETIVRFTPRRRLRAPALLQSVAHTGGVEIRPYGDDFAAFAALRATGVPIGVADMAGTTGTVDGRAVDLGRPDDAANLRMAGGVESVVAMLTDDAFADLVEPGSIRVDPVTGMSQHAWGSLPAGDATDADGALDGWTRLRVVDGSILPGPLRSGPHASIVMLAVLLGDRL